MAQGRSTECRGHALSDGKGEDVHGNGDLPVLDGGSGIRQPQQGTGVHGTMQEIGSGNLDDSQSEEVCGVFLQYVGWCQAQSAPAGFETDYHE